ncbi:MAG: radical SAM protein [Thermoplasmata archaeon]|nr:MAG: radical SAM protein [Thermoplasmata archaeon]
MGSQAGDDEESVGEAKRRGSLGSNSITMRWFFNYATSPLSKVVHLGGARNWYAKSKLRWPWFFPVDGAPMSLGIEVTNACNLKCIMCHRQVMTRKVGFMDFELFKECAHQGIEMGVKMIVPFNYGEALLHPRLIDMVEYIKSRSRETIVKVNTNGMLLTKDYARNLIGTGIDEITFSLEGCTKESHERIAIGSDYDSILANVIDLIDMRKGNAKPRIRACMVRMEETESEMKQFVKKWRPIVDSITIHDMNTGYGTLKDRRVRKSPLKRKVPCRELWLKLQVLWDGSVTVCCIDYDGDLKIGNVKYNSLYELWLGSKLRRMREIHRDREFEKIQICNKCDSDNTL